MLHVTSRPPYLGCTTQQLWVEKMTTGTFVLVPGSWHGGWCWRKIVPLLREGGYEVLAPTLTGTGDRSHLLTRDTDLALHIQDIVQTVEYEDLHEVILVGHSYGGMVITGVAEHVLERIACLIYLDFLPPDDGQCVFDFTPDGGASARWAALSDGDGWLVPPRSPEAFGVDEPIDIAWMQARLRPMPLATFEQPVRARIAARLPRSLILCSESKGFSHVVRRAQDAKLAYHELAAGHDAMVTAPAELAQILLACAAARSV